MIRSGSASMAVHERARISNSPRESRIKTQRKGTAGNLVLHQRAAAETTSTARFSPPRHSLTVMGVHAVAGSSATVERLGNLSPFRRGRPI